MYSKHRHKKGTGEGGGTILDFWLKTGRGWRGEGQETVTPRILERSDAKVKLLVL